MTATSLRKLTSASVKVGVLSVGIALIGSSAQAADNWNSFGNSGIGNGNQVKLPVQLPIDLCGNAITLLGGNANAGCTGGASADFNTDGLAANWTTAGNSGLLNGNQVDAIVQAPVSVCGNAIAVLGNASAWCTGGSSAVIGDSPDSPEPLPRPRPYMIKNAHTGTHAGTHTGTHAGTHAGALAGTHATHAGTGAGTQAVRHTSVRRLNHSTEALPFGDLTGILPLGQLTSVLPLGQLTSLTGLLGSADGGMHTMATGSPIRGLATTGAKRPRAFAPTAGTRAFAPTAGTRAIAPTRAASRTAAYGESDSCDLHWSTSNNSGLLNGNQVFAPVQAPIDISGNAVGVVGSANASSVGGASATFC